MRARLIRPAAQAQNRQIDPRGCRPGPRLSTEPGGPGAPQNRPHSPAEWRPTAWPLRGARPRRPLAGTADPGARTTARDAGRLPPRKSSTSLRVLFFRVAPPPDGAQRIPVPWLPAHRTQGAPGRPSSQPVPEPPRPDRTCLPSGSPPRSPQERRRGATPPGAAPAVPRRPSQFVSLCHGTRCPAAPASGVF
ncbi:hypothetical protein NDU88_006430 [Pleurodeles waltl]|uniref:Uncharacterized protein n=1 Tax=Pleurodeles waltl TaxID=8319 RepID=A0AAV7QHZ8_PLEWA|nr:hypothetical protein NDU88_006430 [Pleurodeles waltl]